MKRIVPPRAYIALIATLLLLAGIAATSCTSDEPAGTNSEESNPTPGKAITIIAGLTDNKPGTRINYEPNTEGGGLKTTWAKKDTFNLISGSHWDDETKSCAFALVSGETTTIGHFEGIAPEADETGYYAFYPATIKTWTQFQAFDYAEQTQTKNNNTDHLSTYHSILVETTDIEKISFASPMFQSSCMKFNLTLPTSFTKPTKIILATEDNNSHFSLTNAKSSSNKSFFLSLLLKDITLAPGDKLTAYMMMSCQTVIPGNMRITIIDEDNKKCYQRIIAKPEDQLTSGKIHSITISDAKSWIEPSTTYTAATIASTSLSIAENGTGEPGTLLNPYLINSAEDLKFVQEVTNGDNVEIDKDAYKYRSYKLTTDITINLPEGTDWVPIGKDEENRFKGNFDGDGHRVTGLSINGDQRYAGFFGYIDEKLTVKNLHIRGNITSSNPEARIGGICGYVYSGFNYSKIIRCSYSGSVTSTTTVAGSGCIGGIAGSCASSSQIIGCYNKATVTNTYLENCGGIVGNIYCQQEEDGLVGCYNTGSVTSKGKKTGGVAGLGRIWGCYNIGKVVGEETNKEKGIYRGGIVGKGDSKNSQWVWASGSTVPSYEGSGGSRVYAISLGKLNTYEEGFKNMNHDLDIWRRSNYSQDCNFEFVAGTGAGAIPVLVPLQKE